MPEGDDFYMARQYGATPSTDDGRGLTAAQVWYVAKVYPERVTDAECRRDYEQSVTTEADRSYWEAAAKVLNELGS